ncbi:DUF5704 domain-containing protein, partial [Paenibacillus illinoisensis]|uniref:DUF5704 domain-containing protein n=1 Tax=Paenibacillus illinoisensis TaxID=59845 RepID=UPI0036F3320C
MKVSILFCCWLLIFQFVTVSVANAESQMVIAVSPDEEDTADINLLPKPVASPVGPTGYQKVVNIVEGVKQATPGVYWFQIDNGDWVAEASNDRIVTVNQGTRANPAPVVTEVPDQIEMSGKSEYLPNTYNDQYGSSIVQSRIIDPHIAKVQSTAFQGVKSVITNLQLTSSKTGVKIISKTGRLNSELYKAEYNEKYGESPNHEPKHKTLYHTPLDITWRGKLVEQKKIRLTGTQRLGIDEEAYLQGEVATMNSGEADFGNWVDISTRSGVEWKSDQSGIVDVNASGKIKGVSPGTAKISVRWKSGDPYQYDLIAYLNVTVGDGPIEHEPGGIAGCKYTINPPNEVDASQTAFMDPDAQGHILADDPTNGIHFDATRGIPTSEHLYANTWAMNYLFQHTFGQQQGTITYDCEADLTYVRTWKVEQPDLPGPDGTTIPQEDTEDSDTVDVTYSFSFERNYSYWNINNVELYFIDQAEMENYALPDGERITLYPQGYTPPELEMEHDEDVEIHVMPQETGDISYVPPVLASDGYEPLDVPDDTELLKGMAEGQTGPPDVKNDALDFTWEGSSTKVMDGSVVVENGPDPTQIPAPTKIGSYKNTGEQVLYEDQLLIPQTRLNKANTESRGEIQYALHPTTLGGSGDKTFPVNPINTVTVHTPVVNYSLV